MEVMYICNHRRDQASKDWIASQQGTVGWHEYLDIQHHSSKIYNWIVHARSSCRKSHSAHTLCGDDETSGAVKESSTYM